MTFWQRRVHQDCQMSCNEISFSACLTRTHSLSPSLTHSHTHSLTLRACVCVVLLWSAAHIINKLFGIWRTYYWRQVDNRNTHTPMQHMCNCNCSCGAICRLSLRQTCALAWLVSIVARWHLDSHQQQYTATTTTTPATTTTYNSNLDKRSNSNICHIPVLHLCFALTVATN